MSKQELGIMRNIWMITRSVLAVFAGIAAMTFVAFAIEIPLRLLALRVFSRTFPDQATLDADIGWMLTHSLYTLPAAVLGGFVAASLAPRLRLAHALAMAILQELLIIILIFNPPHPVPGWMWAITLTVTPVAIISGGYLRIRKAVLSEMSAERLSSSMR